MRLRAERAIRKFYASVLLGGSSQPSVHHINPVKVGTSAVRGVAACQGSGTCAAECPAKAIQLAHCQDGQIWAELQVVTSSSKDTPAENKKEL
jgi:coenzyme F420-reducing hydrogenase gamma subunit